MDHTRIAILLQRHVQDDCTVEELSELSAWRNADTANEALFQRLIENGGAVEALKEYYSFDPDVLEAKIIKNISRQSGQSSIANRTVHRVHFLKTAWLRYAAAVILVLGVGGYLWMKADVTKHDKGPVFTGHKNNTDTMDILPGTNRAMLVLGDESVIALDTAANGVLASQGESQVIKTESGEIVYVTARKAVSITGEVYYQKIITPRGGTYQVTLSDGTQVWLNAESSVRFPNVFAGQQRTVEVTGEVYFDVKADKSKPFVVKTNTDEITVLGTEFNVNAYANEGGLKTTLVDGAVKVAEKILQPGQAYRNGKVAVTNVAHDVAWRKGMFSFTEDNLEGIMRQVSRWYDVEIVYEGKVPNGEITGEVSRTLPLSKLLNGLSVYGFNYRIDHKRVIISSK